MTFEEYEGVIFTGGGVGRPSVSPDRRALSSSVGKGSRRAERAFVRQSKRNDKFDRDRGTKACRSFTAARLLMEYGVESPSTVAGEIQAYDERAWTRNHPDRDWRNPGLSGELIREPIFGQRRDI